MQELEIVRETIQNEYRVVKTDEDLEWNRAIDLCTNIINARLSSENASKIARSSRDNNGWIPVEERMPEEPKANPQFEGKKIELYLVTVNGTKYPFRAFWNGKFFADGWSKCEVIAWRPLPEPYRPENKTEASDWREDMLRKFDRRD